MSNNYLSPIEIGKLIEVHHSTVIRWIQKGKLKTYTTIGGHNRVKPKDLIEFVKENNLPFPDKLIDWGKTKVLIVDDDPSVLEILARGLEANPDFIVYTAKDGFEAGHMVKEIVPDVVVLDIRLPGIDGYGVCRLIKEKHPETKVIAITGEGSRKVEQDIIDAGADSYLVKPFNLPDLFENVETLLMNEEVLAK